VYRSLAWKDWTFLNSPLPTLAIRPQRDSDATTSSATHSFPLWKGTPRRRRIVQVLPPSETAWPSASIGTTP
jgi:hypothetical protein